MAEGEIALWSQCFQKWSAESEYRTAQTENASSNYQRGPFFPYQDKWTPALHRDFDYSYHCRRNKITPGLNKTDICGFAMEPSHIHGDITLIR